MLPLNAIYNQDCLEGMRFLDDNCIDLTVTSPPYDNLRTISFPSWDLKNCKRCEQQESIKREHTE